MRVTATEPTGSLALSRPPRPGFVPALRFRWLTRFYDPVVAAMTREAIFRQRLLEQANLHAGQRVLDLACGSGSMAVLIKQQHPRVSVTGLDGDPEILALARAKAQAAGLDIRFDEGLSIALPYGQAEFDVVFSSLFFHHLDSDGKVRALREVLRVLRPGGTLHVCDWGRPSNFALRLSFSLIRMLDGFEVTRDNARGRLPQLMMEAGFADVNVTSTLTTAMGTLDFIVAGKARDSANFAA
jgi:ubiquinone/menaquinone biosynthesis C-methylase UbiE